MDINTLNIKKHIPFKLNLKHMDKKFFGFHEPLQKINDETILIFGGINRCILFDRTTLEIVTTFDLPVYNIEGTLRSCCVLPDGTFICENYYIKDDKYIYSDLIQYYISEENFIEPISKKNIFCRELSKLDIINYFKNCNYDSIHKIYYLENNVILFLNSDYGFYCFSYKKEVPEQ